MTHRIQELTRPDLSHYNTRPTGRNDSKETATAKEVWDFIGKPKTYWGKTGKQAFPFFRLHVKRIGEEGARMILDEMRRMDREGKLGNAIAFWTWSVKQHMPAYVEAGEQ